MRAVAASSSSTTRWVLNVMVILTRVLAVRKLELTAAIDNADAGGILAYL
jgi:hypothetical protein